MGDAILLKPIKLPRRACDALDAHIMEHIPVRKLFWDSLEFALQSQVRRLAKDIAGSLGVSEIPLLNALKEETRVYLFDEQADQVDLTEMRCQHLVPLNTTSPYLTPCCAPVLWSSKPGAKRDKCLQHSLVSYKRPQLPTIKAVPDTKYYVDGEYVYLDDGTLVGRYCPDSKVLRLFAV